MKNVEFSCRLFNLSKFTALPLSYGSVRNAYDVFWCVASLVSGGVITSGEGPIEITISSNSPTFGDGFLELFG